MDYEKKYKEALKRAKILYNDKNEIGYANAESVLEEVFPLLKEPEDEKIRKALIEMVHDTTGDSLWVDYNVHKEDAIAWLEKQGKKNSVTTEEEEKVREQVVYAINKLNVPESEKNKLLAWLEKQGEQKPQRMISAEAKEAIYGKPAYAWSEKDEHRVKDTIYFLDTAKKHYASTVELDACINWLKSLKHRIGG